MAKWERIKVAASRPYPILLGMPLEGLGDYLQAEVRGISSIAVITQQLIADYHLDRLMAGLGSYQVGTFIVPQGEEAKSLENIDRLTTAAVKAGLDRHSLIIALGGGIVGDLAGFFASIYMRGIRFLQVPTTLLAQVDSSIGGKVAVNHAEGKNLLGAFYPPVAIDLDFATLKTLPWEEVQNGLAETIKHAVLGDPDFFTYLEGHKNEIIERNFAVWQEVVTRSLAIKVRIVEEDEQEQGKRAFLNLGHSFGHALEAEGHYRELTHGQGVSIGLAAAAYLAKGRGYLQDDELERIISLLSSFGLPISVSGKDASKLLGYMTADKKNRGGTKVLILPKGIGQVVARDDCGDGEILAAWEKVIRHRKLKTVSPKQ